MNKDYIITPNIFDSSNLHPKIRGLHVKYRFVEVKCIVLLHTVVRVTGMILKSMLQFGSGCSVSIRAGCLSPYRASVGW